jgi:hypothetical protein
MKLTLGVRRDLMTTRQVRSKLCAIGKSFDDCVEREHLLERAKGDGGGSRVSTGDDDDPLDAFMADIKKEAAKPSAPKASACNVQCATCPKQTRSTHHFALYSSRHTTRITKHATHAWHMEGRSALPPAAQGSPPQPCSVGAKGC